MKIVFFGTDDFALICLEALAASEHEVVACVTPPDRAKGRGMKVQAPVTKAFAKKHKIPVLQPETLKDAALVKKLKGYGADVFAVVAYGQILPAEVLKIPRLFCVNVHGSLLPHYRGAAPVNWAILNGDPETGVSLIRMNEKMDAGNILLQERTKISPEDTAVTLRLRLAELGSRALVRLFDGLTDQNHPSIPQDPAYATKAPKLTKDLGTVAWEQGARQIHNQVRGLLPWPAARTSYKGKSLKLLASCVEKGTSSKPPGTVLEVSPKGILVAAGEGQLLITRVQPESGKAMTAQAFAAGQRIKAGDQFTKTR